MADNNGGNRKTLALTAGAVLVMSNSAVRKLIERVRKRAFELVWA